LFENLILTQLAAFYGAIIATVSLCWTIGWCIFMHWKELKKLRLDVNLVEFIGCGCERNPSFSFVITNIGRTTVVVTSIGGELHARDNRGGNMQFIILNISGLEFPRRLQEGEFMRGICPIDNLKSHLEKKRNKEVLCC
jgi:hypothetical protein